MNDPVGNYLKSLYRNKYLFYQLVFRDQSARYRSSRMGMFWSLAEPLLFVAVMFLVFGIGLRGRRSMDMPFLCYLISGMAVVRYFTQVLSRGTTVIKRHSYILKKLDFRLSFLPAITVVSCFIDHLLFFIPLIIVFFSKGIFPDLFWFQILYYMFCLTALLIGMTWFISSVSVFIQDLQHIVPVFSRLIFYFTPVFWSAEKFSPELLKILKFNPLYYIAMGYRESLFYKVAFWEHPVQTIYFWSWVLIMGIIGIVFFKKLRPQIADYI